MDGAMLSNSLIQFSVDGCGCVPSLLFDLRPNYGGADEDNGDVLQRSLACTATLSPLTPQQATANPRLRWRLLDTHWQVWASPEKCKNVPAPLHLRVTLLYIYVLFYIYIYNIYI